MNIYEYLGLSKDHREPDKTAMKVKHWAEVPQKKKEGVMYLAQEKKDGIFCFVVRKDQDDYAFFSRTGKELSSTDLLLQDMLDYGKNFPNGVYIAELCCDMCSLEALSGIFNPNRKKGLDENQAVWCANSKLHFYDFLEIDEFIHGESWRYANARFKIVYNVVFSHYFPVIKTDTITASEVEKYAKDVIVKGGEGAVFKEYMETWTAGHRGHKSMKIVRGVSYDLLCIDVEEGTGKYKGKVANLIFRWKDGKTVKAMLGKGWTHEEAEAMWIAATAGFPLCDNPLGEVFEVYALQESSKGKLRQPKVGARRFDKLCPDY